MGKIELSNYKDDVRYGLCGALLVFGLILSPAFPPGSYVVAALLAVCAVLALLATDTLTLDPATGQAELSRGIRGLSRPRLIPIDYLGSIELDCYDIGDNRTQLIYKARILFDDSSLRSFPLSRNSRFEDLSVELERLKAAGLPVIESENLRKYRIESEKSSRAIRELTR